MYFRLMIKNKLWQILPWEMFFLTNISTFHTLHVLFNQADLYKRGWTTNGKIGPVANQFYEIWNCAISLYE